MYIFLGNKNRDISTSLVKNKFYLRCFYLLFLSQQDICYYIIFLDFIVEVFLEIIQFTNSLPCSVQVLTWEVKVMVLYWML